jgi:hypothetical protein
VLVALAAQAGSGVIAQEAQQPFVQAIGTLPVASAEGTTQFILRARADRVQAIAERHDLTVIGPVDEHQHDVFLVSGPATYFNGALSVDSSVIATAEPTAAELTESVQSDPEVGHFEPNSVVVTPEVASGINLNHSTVEILDALRSRTLVPYFGASAWTGYLRQPGASAVRVADTHDKTGTGSGVVAIIDTGIDPNHPLLAGALVPGYDFVNDVAGDASEWKDLDHSTVEILDHSTVEILDTTATPVPINPSTIAILNATAPLDPALLPAAFGHGTMVAGVVRLVAPTAKIMPLKAFRADGTSRVFDIVRAIYYAADNGARVINMSFSATAASPELARAINYATDRGVICVASAGNLGQEVVVYPAGFRNVLAVASTNAWTLPRRSLFSNYGDALVSLAAPGEGIVTTYPGGSYAAAWGTSFSAPMVAGGAALMVQVDPTINYQKASELFGRAIAMPGGMGRGRLNLYDAVRALRDTIAPSVTLLSPATGGTVAGTVTVAANASDNLRVRSVRFVLNGRTIADQERAPYEFSWNSTLVPNGTYTLVATASDAEGNTASTTNTFTVRNDFSPPTVNLTSPTSGAVIGGTVVVNATATDDLGVSGVRFTLDGAPLGAEDIEAPYAVVWNTEPVTDGAHTLSAIARDAVGKQTATSISIIVTHDTTPPSIAVVQPVTAAVVSGIASVSAQASDNVGVTSVQFLLDGAPLGTPLTVAPFQVPWSTTGIANGTHVLSATARDAAGHVATASPITITVRNDIAPPTAGLTSPTPGATVAGVFTVAATATDDVGVVSVQFMLDQTPLGTADTVAPFTIEWTTTSVANGAHTLSAVARDGAGRESAAPPVVVNVRNDQSPPTVTITGPSPASAVEGAVTIAATAVDDIGVTSVQFMVDGLPLGEPDSAAPYEATWSTTNLPNGTHTVSALARDEAGHEGTAAEVIVTVRNDTAPPSVAVTGPSASATVAGVVTLAALASDDVGVSGVQFQVDGINVGAEDVAAPYEMSWSTTSAGNGVHTIGAIARDAAGRASTATISVSVLNDTMAPAVLFTAPTNGATVGGTVIISASASDDVGVASVRFVLDGAPLSVDTAAPFEAEWQTVGVANGAHTLTVIARDAAGHETTSAIGVAVLNDHAPPTISITEPLAGASAGGIVVIKAVAADDVGVSGVRFMLDGVLLGAEDTTAPYEMTWDTTLTANGSYTVTAVARDAAGREASTSAVLLVNNEPPR